MNFDYKNIFSNYKKKNLSFSKFIDILIKEPLGALQTSSSLIADAIKYFGIEIVIRSGVPMISYKIFEDVFFNGINAVFGQEYCIKHVVDIIESMGKESTPNRGIVLVGPPASGKTNIVDLISNAMEEYTNHHDMKLYSFYLEFGDQDKNGKVEMRSSFNHNPILLIPTVLKTEGGISHPRREVFEYINMIRGEQEKLFIPAYYHYATIDKRILDILDDLLVQPENEGKSLFDILDEYVRIEEISFSNAQAKGIANIDDMKQLPVRTSPDEISKDSRSVLQKHLTGAYNYRYTGAMISANRGLLHIHDAFGIGEGSKPSETEYKPLLMLLGSGKVSLESTQASVDTTVILTTNIEEMELLDKQLTSSKLLDRIERVPVNYLLDAYS
jgi:predicted Ser/Thr protein kinase